MRVETIIITIINCCFRQGIIEFVNEGGNLLIAGSTQACDLVRELSTEVGVEMDEEEAAVIDHLHDYPNSDDGQVHCCCEASKRGETG